MTIVETISRRRSCRTYDARAIEPEKISILREYLALNRGEPFGSALRFEVMDFKEMEPGELKKLTTYGVIRGARHFMAGAVEKKHPMAMEDFGYCLEKAVLKATSLGLGTCILGGTFRRSGFADRMNMQDDELLPAVTPLGYPRDRRSLVDRMFRAIASSDKRKSRGELFFHGDAGTALDNVSAGQFFMPLECVRLAPSASNKQPWRVIKNKDDETFHFYLKRTPGYEKIVKDIRLQNIDMGIAMCHFDLSAAELGYPGDWTVDEPGIDAAGMEYVASWTARDNKAYR